jgi:hypothetical protein
MSYGRAKKAIPAKKTPTGTTISGSSDPVAAVGSVLDSSGIIASLDAIGAKISTQDASAAEYTPDSLLQNITIDDGDVLFVEKSERYNDITNNGKIIILPTGSLIGVGNFSNSGTVLIHNEGRLIT